jgi:hypothetical protein
MKFACYADWDPLSDRANALFAQAEKHSLFYSRPWFENLTRALDDDETMLLACVVDSLEPENKVLAILPLIRSGENNFVSLKHRYTTHYSLLLADPEHDQEQVLTCLVQGLSQLPVESLLLEPVADNDNGIVGLQRTLESAGYRCERYFRFYNWIYRVQGQSFKDYMASRPARLRNTISRKRRKLDREHGYQIRLFTGDEVPAAMPDYYAVYTASWKANEQYTNFLDGIVEGFSNTKSSASGSPGRGWSRLAVLYVKGQPIAAQLWFVLHAKASIFRLAYDEAWKQYSPGSILTSFLMEYVIDTDQVEEIDFLTGNDRYKQDWMSERKERFALSCVKKVKPAGRLEQLVKLLSPVGIMRKLRGI